MDSGYRNKSCTLRVDSVVLRTMLCSIDTIIDLATWPFFGTVDKTLYVLAGCDQDSSRFTGQGRTMTHDRGIKTGGRPPNWQLTRATLKNPRCRGASRCTCCSPLALSLSFPLLSPSPLSHGCTLHPSLPTFLFFLERTLQHIPVDFYRINSI